MPKKRRKHGGASRAARARPHRESQAAERARLSDWAQGIEASLLTSVGTLGYDIVEVKLDGRRNLRITIDRLPEELPGPGGCPSPHVVRAEAVRTTEKGVDLPADAETRTDPTPPRRSGPTPLEPTRGGSQPIRIADCQIVSRAAQAALTEAGHDPGLYQIEVASPGVDRPLTRQDHYDRFRGSQVTLSLLEARAEDGRRNFTGRLVGANETSVTVHVLDRPEPEAFELGAIRVVRLRPAIEAPPRPTAPRKGRRGRKRGDRGRGRGGRG